MRMAQGHCPEIQVTQDNHRNVCEPWLMT